MLSGDFFQLPPVKDFPLYSDAKSKKSEKISYEAQKGIQLYNYIVNNNSVVLDVIKRTENKEYATLQERVRLGNWDTNMILTINQRVDATLTDVLDGSQVTDSDYQPILVVRNKTRQQIYESAMIKIANNLKNTQQQLPIILYAKCSVRQSRKRKDPKTNHLNHNPELSLAEIGFLHSLPDNITDKMPMGFLLYLGSYVSITKNLGVKYNLANGTRGKVIGWQFPEGTVFHESMYKGIKVSEPYRCGTVNFIQENIECIQFVLIKLCSKAVFEKPLNQPPDLPDNVVAIPIIKVAVSTSIQLPNVSSRKNVNINIQQLPLRQCMTPTTYTIQGCQFSKYTIAETSAKDFYVAFSRGKQGL